MKNFSEFILIRHGETISNSEGRFQGSRDSPLSDRGRADAVRLGEYFRERLPSVDYWYVSPYGRARDTSRLIREQMDAAALPDEEVHQELREIHCGEFETRLHKEVDQDILKKIRREADFRYPGGGESKLDVAARARVFLNDFRERIKREERNSAFRAVVVAHGNLNICLGGVLLDVDPTFTSRAVILNTGICRFLTPDIEEPCRLLSWGETPHLGEWRTL